MTIKEKFKMAIALWKTNKVIKLEGTKMKSGWKTSEFWVSIITIAVTVLSAVAGFVSPELMIKIVAIIASVYAIARAVVKLTPTKVDDEILDKIEAVLRDKDLLKSEEKPK